MSQPLFLEEKRNFAKFWLIIKRRFNAQGHNRLGHVKAIWNYVMDMRMQNLTFSRSIIKCPLLLSSNYWSRCEHYSWRNRDHLKIVLDESFDIEYMEAHFNEDMDELERIELRAAAMVYGPRFACTTVTNFSAQQVCCHESVHLCILLWWLIYSSLRPS